MGSHGRPSASLKFISMRR